MNTHYLVAKNGIEAEILAIRAFNAAKSPRDLKTKLFHDTSKGQVYKATRLANGNVQVEVVR